MIPKLDRELDSNLPVNARYWVPGEEDVIEDGIGFFHETWLISDISAEHAALVLAEDERLLALVDSLARTSEEYETIATAVECGDPVDLPHVPVDDPMRAAILAEINDEDFAPLEGLEIGVAGIVYALNAAGFLTAASCRGHVGSTAWSDEPVVFVATDRPRAQQLAPLVASHRCGFAIDFDRPELLVIRASSAREMIELAKSVLRDPASFGPPVFRAAEEGVEPHDW
jgi:hypothetical protein